ncbi:MAG: SprT family zinc-dependent metalloprotease [Pseudomonadota bacterium]
MDQLDLLDSLKTKAPFMVRHSKRARNMTIHVIPHRGVEVVVPHRARPGDIERFVHQHRAWIDETQAALDASTDAPLDVLPESIELKAIGKSVSVEYEQITGPRQWRVMGKNAIGIRPARRDFEVGRDVLKKWLQHEGKRWLVPWLRDTSDELQLPFKRAQVRGQKTRWGSYSSTGTLCINYYLMLLEPDLVRYLFVHELCHTRHMNHSSAFWSLVESYDPDYRRKETRLNDTRALLPAWLLQY